MTFVRKQTRTKNQIKAILQLYGYRVPPEIPDYYWSRAYIRWLESLSFDHESGRVAFQALLRELLALRATIADLTKQIRHMAQQDRYRARVELLLSVSGIGLLAAMTFLCEVTTLDRFKNLDCLLNNLYHCLSHHCIKFQFLQYKLLRNQYLFHPGLLFHRNSSRNCRTLCRIRHLPSIIFLCNLARRVYIPHTGRSLLLNREPLIYWYPMGMKLNPLYKIP